jgi:hypothetical protein
MLGRQSDPNLPYNGTFGENKKMEVAPRKVEQQNLDRNLP